MRQSNTRYGFAALQVKEALRQGLAVVATCRKSSEELEGLDGPLHILPGLDVTEDSAPQDLEKFLKDKGWNTVDAVISISGLFTFDSFEDPKPDGIIKMYQVCALGPLRLFSHLVQAGILIGVQPLQ